MRANKPLLGFGPIGWALLPVAAALVVVLVTGYDLRHDLLRLIQYVFGNEGMSKFVTYFLSFHALNIVYRPYGLGFGLIAMCLLFVAMHLHPRRLGTGRWLLATALGVLTPPAFAYIATVIPKPNPASYTPILLSEIIVHIIAAIGLWWIFKSQIVLIGSILIFAISITTTYLLAMSFTGPFLGTDWIYSTAVYYTSWAWNPALFALFMFVAIRERLRDFPDHACHACGYDLRGSADTCPECGEKRSKATNERSKPPPPAPTGEVPSESSNEAEGA